MKAFYRIIVKSSFLQAIILWLSNKLIRVLWGVMFQAIRVWSGEIKRAKSEISFQVQAGVQDILPLLICPFICRVVWQNITAKVMTTFRYDLGYEIPIPNFLFNLGTWFALFFSHVGFSFQPLKFHIMPMPNNKENFLLIRIRSQSVWKAKEKSINVWAYFFTSSFRSDMPFSEFQTKTSPPKTGDQRRGEKTNKQVRAIVKKLRRKKKTKARDGVFRMWMMTVDVSPSHTLRCIMKRLHLCMKCRWAHETFKSWWLPRDYFSII